MTCVRTCLSLVCGDPTPRRPSERSELVRFGLFGRLSHRLFNLGCGQRHVCAGEVPTNEPFRPEPTKNLRNIENLRGPLGASGDLRRPPGAPKSHRKPPKTFDEKSTKLPPPHRSAQNRHQDPSQDPSRPVFRAASGRGDEKGPPRARKPRTSNLEA